MKNNIENGIYIPEEQRNLIPVDEWVKREDPTTAQTVVLVTDFGMLEIAKEDLPGDRKITRLNSSHNVISRMPSSA